MSIPPTKSEVGTESAVGGQIAERVLPLRILMGADISPDPNSGASGTVLQTIHALRQLGHHVDEIWANDLGRRIRHGNLHYAMELPWAYRRELRRVMQNCRYDVVEFNQPHAWLAAAEFQRKRLPGVFINRSHGHEIRYDLAMQTHDTRRLLNPHRVFSSLLRRRLWSHWDKVARHSDGFVVSSQEDSNFIRDYHGVAAERIAIISQGVPDSYLASPVREMTDSRTNRIIYIGNFTPCKGPTLLAKTVNDVLSVAPAATFTWVCESEYHQPAIQLFDPSVRERVTLRDWMPQAALMSVLDEHGIFLFPSLFEGFGKAPLEAMARGLCVIASNTGGMRDYVVNRVNGLLTPVGVTDPMSKCCLRLLSDASLLRNYSRQAIATAAAHTWKKTAQALTDFYRTCLVNK